MKANSEITSIEISSTGKSQSAPRNHEHQDEPTDPVADQDVEAVAQGLGTILPDGELHTLGKPRRGAVHVLLDPLDELEDALLAHAIDLDQHGGLAVETGPAVLVLEAVHHPGNLAEQEPRPVLPGVDHDALELLSGVGLALGAQQHFSARGLDRAPGTVQGAAAHGAHHLIEGEPVAAQGFLGQLD
jgi:hypothetical protein